MFKKICKVEKKIRLKKIKTFFDIFIIFENNEVDCKDKNAKHYFVKFIVEDQIFRFWKHKIKLLT